MRTTLTRTLALLREQGWIRVKPGQDKRERLFFAVEALSEALAGEGYLRGGSDLRTPLVILVFFGIGYLFGNLPWVHNNFGLVTIIVILASMIPLGVVALRDRRARDPAG